MNATNPRPDVPWHAFPRQPLEPTRHARVRALVMAEATTARSSSYPRPARGWLTAPVAAISVGAVIVGAGFASGAWRDSSGSAAAGMAASASAGTRQALPSTSPTSDRRPRRVVVPAQPTGSDSPTVTSTSSAKTSKSPDDVAYPIPNWVAFSKAQLPADQKHLFDLGQYANILTVAGQVCDHPGAHGARPIAGRWWSWYASNSVTSHTVDLVVTGWKPGTGAANFADVVHDTGYCIWLHPVTTKAGITVAGADQTYAAVSNHLGLHVAYVVVRVGDLLGAVSVQDHHGTEPALVTARRLAAIAAQKLSRVSVPPAA